MALEALIGKYMDQISKDTNLGQQIYNKLINSINEALGSTVRQIDMQLDPKFNKALKYIIGGFTISSTKDGINPSQLYGEMVNIYKQNLFGNDQLANIYMLSALYIRALKKLGYPDPVTGKKEYTNIARQERENVQNIVNMVGDLLAKSLHEYYKSIGKDVTEEEIAANLYVYASAFYSEYAGIINKVRSYITSKTPNVTLLESTTRLMSTLDDIFMSSIESLIYTMYSKVQIPGVVSLILNSWGQYGFYRNWFDIVSSRIGGYVSPRLQQPLQPPASQQPAPQQQQAPQGGQSANQFRQPPGPHVLKP
jgi:hypothetical protein